MEVDYMRLQDCHVLYVVLITQMGLKPLLASPSLIFQGSDVKLGYCLSNSFYAFASIGCLKTPSLIRHLSCHIISSAILDDL